jgi:hypothetical protein
MDPNVLPKVAVMVNERIQETRRRKAFFKTPYFAPSHVTRQSTPRTPLIKAQHIPLETDPNRTRQIRADNPCLFWSTGV